MVRPFRRKTSFFFHFFLKEPIVGTPRHAWKKKTRKYSKISLRRANIKSYHNAHSRSHPETKYLPDMHARILLFVVFFLPEILNLKTQIPQKNILKNVTKKKNSFANGLAGVYTTRVPSFRVYLQKTAWALGTWQIWCDTDMLEPACTQCFSYCPKNITLYWY